MVLHIYCTLIWEPLCDLQRTRFAKLTIGAGKDITFLKSMGRQHLPLSGPWCPYCNKGISFKIRDSFLRRNAKPSHWTRWWASYFCKAKFQSSAWLLYVVLLWKLKVLTKQVTAGTKERDCSLTYWQQTSLIVLSASKRLPKAWHAAGCEGRGMAIWWHHYHAMAFVVGISSGQTQLSPWVRKGSLIMGDEMMQERGNFQSSTQG